MQSVWHVTEAVGEGLSGRGRQFRFECTGITIWGLETLSPQWWVVRRKDEQKGQWKHRKCLFQYLTTLCQLNSRRPKSLTPLHIFTYPKSKHYFSCLWISLIYIFLLPSLILCWLRFRLDIFVFSFPVGNLWIPVLKYIYTNVSLKVSSSNSHQVAILHTSKNLSYFIHLKFWILGLTWWPSS